jgi:hypothetical protein
LGGTLNLSNPVGGNGTSVIVRLPLPVAAAAVDAETAT